MITSRAHGILDYLTVLIFALAPTLLTLSEMATILAYTLAAVHLLMTLFTGFSLSLIKIIPFQIHGYVELIVGLILAVGPWLTGGFFSPTGQLFFGVMGIVILIVWTLTTYKNPLKQ
jgi:hypothetical protein